MISDYLSLKEIIKGPKRGDIVRIVRHPEIQGVYQIKKRHISSNYPYRVEHEGELWLIEKQEVESLGKLL